MGDSIANRDLGTHGVLVLSPYLSLMLETIAIILLVLWVL